MPTTPTAFVTIDPYSRLRTTPIFHRQRFLPGDFQSSGTQVVFALRAVLRIHPRLPTTAKAADAISPGAFFKCHSFHNQIVKELRPDHLDCPSVRDNYSPTQQSKKSNCLLNRGEGQEIAAIEIAGRKPRS
jgi:hypothetical protein